MANKIFTYDVEIFPNYASFLFVDMEDYLKVYDEIHDDNGMLVVSEDVRIERVLAIPYVLFEISSVEEHEVCDILALLDYINNDDYLVGFNSLGYDNILLNMLAMDVFKFTSTADINKKLYALSKKIVETDIDILRNDDKFTLYKFYRARYSSIDIQKVAALDKVFKGLKQTLINISWFSINDFELPPIDEVKEGKYYKVTPEFYKYINKWDRYLIKEHLPELVKYNANDVYGTCELFCFLKKNIILRFNIKDKYNINVLSSSNSDIGNRFISKYYSDYTGLDYKEFKDLRTYRSKMNIGKIISPLISFKTKTLNELLSHLMYTTVTSTDQIDFRVNFNNVDFDIKSGGLHSKDSPGSFSNIGEDTDYIKDFDFNSYYPLIWYTLRTAPKHLIKEAILTVIKAIIDDRLEAKKLDDDTDAQALKITINAAYGKTNFAYSFLFDTLCTLTITINGQLMLLMLIEQLAIAGISTISANTDGIICKIPRDKLDTYYKICDDFTEYVDIGGEYTDYVKYFRLDVNNYITVKRKKDGTLDVKRKGALNQNLCTEDLQKGFNRPIIAKAVEEYFINDVPVRDTVLNERNIYLFCATQNMNSEYTPVYRKVVNGKFKEEVIQKHVRFYVSNGGGVLQKKKNDKYTSVISGENVTIFNDYFSVQSFDDYNVNYGYYIKEINNIIAIIESGIKGKTKKIKNIQSNRFMGSLFDNAAMEDCKIPCKEDELELVDVAQRVLVPITNLQDEIETFVTKPVIDTDAAFTYNTRDESFESNSWVKEDSNSFEDLNSSFLKGESGNDLYDTDEDDMPF